MFLRRIKIHPGTSLALLPILLPEQKNYNDIPHTQIEPPEKKLTTGFERVVNMYKLDEFGSPTKELLSALNTGFISAFVGGGIGGVKESRLKYEFFVTKFNSETFVSHFEAKNQLTRHMAVAFVKGFCFWGIRLGFFNTLFILTTHMLAAYNDQLRIWNFAASGVFAGAVYRIPRGIRAMAAAGLTGGTLGLIAGCISVGLLTAFDTSYDEIQKWHYDMRNARERAFEENSRRRESDDVEAPLKERTEVFKKAALEALKQEAESQPGK